MTGARSIPGTMPYRYEDEKPWIFSDEGQRVVIKARDKALALFRAAGAATGERIVADAGPGAWSNWQQMGVVERLVELGVMKPTGMEREYLLAEVYVPT